MPTIARRPWGLIVVVLIIDAALAVAGALMLSQGLSDRQSAKTTAPRSGAVTPVPPGGSGATAATATGAPPAASGSSSTSR
jgi:hypothetical protein